MKPIVRGGVGLAAAALLGLSACAKQPESVPFLGAWEGEFHGQKVEAHFKEGKIEVVEGDDVDSEEVVYFRSIGKGDPVYAAAIVGDDEVLVLRMEGDNKLKVYEGGEGEPEIVLIRKQ